MPARAAGGEALAEAEACQLTADQYSRQTLNGLMSGDEFILYHDTPDAISSPPRSLFA